MVVIVGGVLTTTVCNMVENSPSTSTSFTVIWKEPDAVGVPLIAPVSGFMVSPAGNVPARTDQAPVDPIAALPAELV